MRSVSLPPWPRRSRVRHDDGHRHSRARSRIGKRLTVVATRCGNYALDLRTFALKPLKINKTAPYFESADRRVVFVLDHDLHAGLCLKQWPSILWRRRGAGANQRDNLFHRLEG